MKCFSSNFIEVYTHDLQNVQNEEDLPDTNHLVEEGKYNKNLLLARSVDKTDYFDLQNLSRVTESQNHRITE